MYSEIKKKMSTTKYTKFMNIWFKEKNYSIENTR